MTTLYKMSDYEVLWVQKMKFWTFVGLYEGIERPGYSVKLANSVVYEVKDSGELVSLPVVQLRSGETVVLNHWCEQLRGWDKCFYVEKDSLGTYYRKGSVKGCVSEIGTIFDYDPVFLN